MMPVVWVESAGLGAHAIDRLGALRHTWQVAYRCPACSTVDSKRLPSRVLDLDGNPAPLDAADTISALTVLINSHQCPPGPAKEPPC